MGTVAWYGNWWTCTLQFAPAQARRQYPLIAALKIGGRDVASGELRYSFLAAVMGRQHSSNAAQLQPRWMPSDAVNPPSTGI
jgi:hypothetical protein